MDRIHHVEVRADRSIAPGSLVWRYGGRLHVTAIAKATFALGVDAPMTLIAPEALFEDDRVPFRRRADVLVRATARRAARVVVQGTDTILQKAVDDAGALGPRPGALRSNVPVPELPDDCDFDLFQRAPADQQLRHLHGDEWIVLEGLHPSIERVTTRIPGARATGRAEGLGASGGAAPFRLEADALFIDVDELRCTITWRAVLPVADLDQLARLRIELGLQIAGQPVSSRRSVDLEGTLELSAQGGLRDAALPFDRTAKPAAPSVTRPAPPSSARHPFEGTLDLSSLAPAPGSTPVWLAARAEPKSTPLLGETTLTMDDSVATRPMAAPFPLAGAASPPISTKPISGAPWSAEPAPHVPAPRADFASTLDLTTAIAKEAASSQPVATPAASDARPRLFRKLPPKKA